MKNVVIVDYDMGNVDSVVRAVEECGAKASVSSDARDFKEASHIILPGVGAFKDGINNIKQRGIESILKKEVIENKVPFLGICLGMQLLADKSFEGGEFNGLGWIPGEVKRLKPVEKDTRIPHIGWNNVDVLKPSALFNNIASGKDFYFVHSYHFVCRNDEDALATTPYCGKFVSAVGHDNIFGVQFHPEKSQKVGHQLLNNFLAL